MGSYGLRKRVAPHRPMLIARVDDPGSASKSTVSTRTESVMSYRTRDSGTFVPDHIADPYAYFLRSSTDQKRKEAELRNKIPARVKTKNQCSTDFPSHVDNGHSFYRTIEAIHTTLPGINHKWSIDKTSLGRFVGGPVTSSDGVLLATSNLRSLFPYVGTADYARRTVGLIDSSSPSNLNPKYFTQKAVAKLAPNAPHVSMSAIIGELRMGLPTIIHRNLPGSVKDLVTGGAGEYVNLSFGIIPAVTDIISVAKVLMNLSDLIQQYESDAANGVRRAMSFPTTDKTVTFGRSDFERRPIISVSNRNFPAFEGPSSSLGSISQYAVSSKEDTVTQRMVQEIWFAGSFTHYLPLGKGLKSNIERYRSLAEKLFSPGLTIESLWQLQPWSWLVDWFIDVDSTISAQARLADDNLVMNYGYLMATTRRVSVSESRITGYNPGCSSSFKSVRTTHSSVRKERLRANPYGFAASSPTSFSTRQWAILAAIGISRM